MCYFVNIDYNLKLVITSKLHFLSFQFDMHFPDKIRVRVSPDRLCEDCGYGQTIFSALATLEYQIYSGDKIQGGIGDNLARSVQLRMIRFFKS